LRNFVDFHFSAFYSL